MYAITTTSRVNHQVYESEFNTRSSMMPAPKKQQTSSGQKGRKSLRVQVTLDPETRERFELIQATIPEIESLSAAIRYASRVAVKHLPKRPSAKPSASQT